MPTGNSLEELENSFYGEQNPSGLPTNPQASDVKRAYLISQVGQQGSDEATTELERRFLKNKFAVTSDNQGEMWREAAASVSAAVEPSVEANKMGFYRNAYNPMSISGLSAWYDASRGVYSDGAAHFTAASSQYLTVASNSTLQGGTDLWIAGWVYLDSNPGIMRIANKASEYSLLWNSGDNSFYFTINGDNASQVNATPVGTTGTWHFVLGWYDSVAKTTNIKVNNGTTATTSYATTFVSSTGALEVGRHDTNVQYWNGRMDSVTIGKSPSGGVTGVISAINTALYNSGNGVTSAGVTTDQKSAWGGISFWDFNEESGTRYDAWGTNHLTASNTALISGATLNGNFEANSAGALTTWIVSNVGSSTTVDEGTIVHAGSHAANMTSDSSGNITQFYQSLGKTGDKYSLSFWAKSDSVTPPLLVQSFTTTVYTATLSTTYTQFTTTFTGLGAEVIFRLATANRSAYVDDVVLTDLGPVSIAGIAAGSSANNDIVATWWDQSANGNHATQATLSKRPVYKTNVLNGKPAIRFDGVDDYLDLGLGGSAATDYTIFAVVTSSVTGQQPVLSTRNLSIPSGGTVTYFGYNSIDKPFLFQDSASTIAMAGATTMTANTYFLLGVLVTASGRTIYRNGASDGSDSSTGTKSIIDGGYFAYDSPISNYLTGDIVEFIAYNSALSTTNRQRIEQYLNQRYAIY